MVLSNLKIRDRFEDKLFLAMLVLAIVYFGVSMVIDFSAGGSGIFIFELIMLLISLLFGRLYLQGKYRTMLMMIYAGVWLLAYVFYWMTSGGIVGPATYVFPTLSVVLMLLLDRNSRFMFVTLLLVTNCFMVFDPEMKSAEVSYDTLRFDYIVSSLFLVLTLVFFKVNFDDKREEIATVDGEVKRLKKVIKNQEMKIRGVECEISAVRNGFQSSVQDRTKELEARNKLLSEYAFINTHLIKGPISRILDLIRLAEIEKLACRSDLKGVKRNVVKLEKVVGRISRVLD